jgi:hypothetical protein
MTRYQILCAEYHNLTNLPMRFVRGTEAKKQRSWHITTGRNIPGFLLKVRPKKFGFLPNLFEKSSDVWLDIDACVDSKLIKEKEALQIFKNGAPNTPFLKTLAQQLTSRGVRIKRF